MAGFGFGLGVVRTASGIDFCIIYRLCRRWGASRPRDGSRSTAPPRTIVGGPPDFTNTSAQDDDARV